ncbi:MAG: phosphopantetheine-binding protein, partial [Pseudonocardiaceae bacterium]
MADTETDAQPADELTAESPADTPPADTPGTVAPARTDMTVPEMRQWLRNWVANATGQSPDAVDEATPMVELGLSSRDAVAMAADIEDRTGVTVSIAAAFEHPTIEGLATWIVEGDPLEDTAGDDTDWTRSGPVERVDIAVVGLATRFPGDMNTPEQTWQALLEGR